MQPDAADVAAASSERSGGCLDETTISATSASCKFERLRCKSDYDAGEQEARAQPLAKARLPIPLPPLAPAHVAALTAVWRKHCPLLVQVLSERKHGMAYF